VVASIVIAATALQPDLALRSEDHDRNDDAEYAQDRDGSQSGAYGES
jgi:hypothetical protein